MSGAAHAPALSPGAPVALAELERLAGGPAHVRIDGLEAGYGSMQVLHGFSLRVARGRSLCLIGPNGAGKSTVLHSMFGLTDVYRGRIEIDGTAVGGQSPGERVRRARMGYVLQASSVFPGMSVEENLWMGGYLMPTRADARRAAEAVLERHPRLAARRRQPAGVLSGGERRLLEIARALMMDPQVLLVDEPSIGLEPRYIDQVFAILERLQREEGRTIIIVEQNARRGLEFADAGYVLVAGRIVIAAPGAALLADEDVGRLFLGGAARRAT